MPDHEPLDIASKDDQRKEKLDPRTRAARDTAGNADAQAASEPMDLQRLDTDRPPPPGRQRTGDPPAKSHQ